MPGDEKNNILDEELFAIVKVVESKYFVAYPCSMKGESTEYTSRRSEPISCSIEKWSKKETRYPNKNEVVQLSGIYRAQRGWRANWSRPVEYR